MTLAAVLVVAYLLGSIPTSYIVVYRATGRDIAFNAITPAQYRALGFPGADDLGNMWQFKRDFNDYYRGARDPAVARRYAPEIMDFAAWLALNAKRVPIE